jgi:hypothetical protein
MITKFNMASGELTYQTRQKGTAEVASNPYELIDQTPSLQLVEIAIQPQLKSMPLDLASVSIDEFLGHQE